MRAKLRDRLRRTEAFLREDGVVWKIALLFALFEFLSALWDVPSSFGWENDGIAPRDLFAGVGLNLKLGSAHRYPLFHNLLVALLSLPALLIAVLWGSDFSALAIKDRVLSVPCMTSIALVAKVVSVMMAVVTVITVARIARRTSGPVAGRLSALCLVCMVTFSFYGRTSNLDVPYLCWSVLALDRLLDIAEHHERRDYVAFGVLLALAVATKDQAYAGFMLTAPLFLMLPILERRGDDRRRSVAHAALSAAAAGGSYLILSGAVFNPTGFLARVRLLTGPNSQDWRQYEQSPTGMLANLKDIALGQSAQAWSWPLTALAWAGVGLVLLGPRGNGLSRRSLRLLPLCYLVSHLVFFTLAVGRSEHRFLLPVFAVLAIYAGSAAAALIERIRGERLRQLVAAGGGLLLLWNLGRVLVISIVGFRDARRPVEEYLAGLPPGTPVETYGHTVYQPRFDRAGHNRVTRIDPASSPSSRNPIAGVTEVRAAYGAVAERRPGVIVVAGEAAHRLRDAKPTGGRMASVQHTRSTSNADARSYFAAIEADRLPGYKTIIETGPRVPGWFEKIVPYQIQGTIGGRYRVLVATGD